MQENINKNLLRYIGYQREYPQGCCVIVGNYLITSGHCINPNKKLIEFEFDENFNPGFRKINIENSQIVFHKSDFCETTFKCQNEKIEEKDFLDICIFDIAPIESPIKFSGIKPQIGEKLISISWFEILKGNLTQKMNKQNINNIFKGIIVYQEYENNNEYLPIQTQANVIDILYHFFLVNTMIKLEEGSSGSPIFNKENEVIGILSGSLPSGNLNRPENNILYQDMYSIINYLKII